MSSTYFQDLAVSPSDFRELAASGLSPSARLSPTAVPIHSDIRTLDGTSFIGSATVVCGGFPCQDISAAEKVAALREIEANFGESVHRIIRELRPRYALVENSSMRRAGNQCHANRRRALAGCARA